MYDNVVLKEPMSPELTEDEKEDAKENLQRMIRKHGDIR